VHTQVRLTVAFQIQLAQNDAAFSAFLKDGRHNNSPVPWYFARQAGVH
jgi:hypothetical protein